jgi:hypothetical protein
LDFPIIQKPLSITKCQILTSRFATFSSLQVLWDLEGVTSLKRSLEAGMARAFVDLGKTFRCGKNTHPSLGFG